MPQRTQDSRATESTDGDRRTGRRHRWWPWRARPIGIVARVLGFAVILHFLVLPQIGGTREALGLATRLNPFFLLVALGLEAASLGAYGQLTRSLLPPDDRPDLWRTYRIVLSSLAVNHVVPGGMAAGGVVQYRLLSRSGVDSADVGFAMATQSLGSAVVLNVLLWVGLVVSIPTSGFQPAYATAAAVGAVLLALAAAAVLALTRGRDRTLHVIVAVFERVPRVDAQRVAAAFQRAANQLKTIAENPRLAGVACGWAAANWVLDMAVLWVFLAVLGFRAPIPDLMVAYGLANVLAAIPISPGGLGVVEATLIVTLVGFGAPRAVAGLAVAAYRLVQFWLPIPAGAAAWGSLAGTQPRGAARVFIDATRERFRDLRRAIVGPPAVPTVPVASEEGGTMRIDTDQRVFTTDGPWGVVADVIIDPVRKVLTHLVVLPHGRHGRARLVTIDEVAAATEAGVLLSADSASLDDHPEVEETQFLGLEEWPRLTDGWDVGLTRVLALPHYPAAGAEAAPAPAPGAGPRDHAMVAYDRIPSGTAEIRRTSRVTSRDGHLVGRVDGVVLTPEHGISHVVLERGHLWGRRDVTIPLSAIESIETDRLQLRLTRDEVKDLPTFPFRRHH